MIAAEDLMIGSIFWDDYGGYNVVTSINCNKVGEAPNTVCAKHIRGAAVGNFSCNDIKPILLTPDVLEMLGFEKSKIVDKYYIIDNNIAVSIADDKIRVIKGNFVCQLVIAEIQFLHTLQNICKVFGKDLKFKTT